MSPAHQIRRFDGAMHPREAIPFARAAQHQPAPRQRPRRLHAQLRDALTAIVFGAASGVGLVLALSQGV